MKIPTKYSRFSFLLAGVVIPLGEEVAKANPDRVPIITTCQQWSDCAGGNWTEGYGHGENGACKRYTGTRQRVCSTVGQGHPSTRRSSVRREACSVIGQCDEAPPIGTAKYVIRGGKLFVEVSTCVDAITECDPTSYTTFPYDKNDPGQTVTFCDIVGNCGTAAPPLDTTSPTVIVDIDWVNRPLVYTFACTDNLTFCRPGDLIDIPYDLNNPRPSFEVCDYAGNCVDVPAPYDITPPIGVVSFANAFAPDGTPRWKKADDFPALQCRLISCTDPAVGAAPQETAGCMSIYEDNTDFPNGHTYADPGGARELIQVVTDPLEPIDGDTCKIQVCDNAGNCTEIESNPIFIDSTRSCTAETSGVLKSADGVCGTCEEGDNDCLCLKGDESKCRDDGPINCHTNPFARNSKGVGRCPGFKNPACLFEPLSTPGCPVFNPCFPEKFTGAVCPKDAKSFCASNPLHYGCNTGDNIDHSPPYPDGGLPG